MVGVIATQKYGCVMSDLYKILFLVCRVVNNVGPQLQEQVDERADESPNINGFPNACPVGAQERLVNAESFLGVQKTSDDVFARLKAIEDRILFLESVSPEYFSSSVTVCKR